MSCSLFGRDFDALELSQTDSANSNKPEPASPTQNRGQEKLRQSKRPKVLPDHTLENTFSLAVSETRGQSEGGPGPGAQNNPGYVSNLPEAGPFSNFISDPDPAPTSTWYMEPPSEEESYPDLSFLAPNSTGDMYHPSGPTVETHGMDSFPPGYLEGFLQTQGPHMDNPEPT